MDRITIEPGKCGGRPCIRGLRIRGKDVLGLLAHEASWEENLEDYPDLEADDILAWSSRSASRRRQAEYGERQLCLARVFGLFILLPFALFATFARELYCSSVLRPASLSVRHLVTLLRGKIRIGVLCPYDPLKVVRSLKVEGRVVLC